MLQAKTVSSEVFSQIKIKICRFTVESTRNRIMVFDYPLINKHSLCSVPSVDQNRVIRCVELIDDESIWAGAEVKQQISVFIHKIGRGAVQMADDAGVLRGFGKEKGIVVGGADMVGFKIEAFESRVWLSEDMGLELERRRSVVAGRDG